VNVGSGACVVIDPLLLLSVSRSMSTKIILLSSSLLAAVHVIENDPSAATQLVTPVSVTWCASAPGVARVATNAATTQATRARAPAICTRVPPRVLRSRREFMCHPLWTGSGLGRVACVDFSFNQQNGGWGYAVT
jgi:hypothetical protein